jgi:isopenicillin-N N-acyltransferase-like protein
MRVLDAVGSPAEIGYAIGVAAPELVHEAVARICRFDLPAGELGARLGSLERLLARELPHVLEEADGLAEGAGVARQDALALSVCSDLSGRLPAWCSLVAVEGEEGILVGKNLDTPAEMAPIQVVERMAPDGALRFAHVTTAGAMWTDGGVNEAGLALVNASLAPAATNPEGLPDGILVRELLARCSDVDEAVALATSRRVRTLGENVLVADAGGRTAVVEMLPAGNAVREGEPAAACNHVLSEELRAAMSREDPLRENSERRFERLREVRRTGGRWTLTDLVPLLEDPVKGIRQDGSAGIWTVATFALSPGERRMWVSEQGGEQTELVEVETSLART